MYYIITLKRELVDTNTYKLHPSLSESVIVNGHGCHTTLHFRVKIVNEYDQEIPQSQTTDKTMAPRGTQKSQDTRKTH